MASSFAPSSNLNPPPSPGPNSSPNVPLTSSSPFHVGFITPPFRDSKIPVTDHLHAHAYIGALDRAGWWRAVAYSSVGWYSIEDLIAEIRYAQLLQGSTSILSLPHLFLPVLASKPPIIGCDQTTQSARTPALLTGSLTRVPAPVCPMAENSMTVGSHSTVLMLRRKARLSHNVVAWRTNQAHQNEIAISH